MAIDFNKDKSSAIERIRALLAMANSSTANESEAAIASARAAKMMTDYNISVGAVELKKEKGSKKVWSSKIHTRVATHHQKLAHACNEMFDVLFFYSKTWNKETRSSQDTIVFIGLEANIEAASLALDYFATAVEKLLEHDWKLNPDFYRSNGKVKYQSFRAGAADRVWLEVRMLKKAQQESSTPEVTALVVVGNEVAKSMHELMFPPDRKVKYKVLKSRTHNETYQRGYAHGGRVDVNREIKIS